jgi:multidrug resistance protein, MATE family
VFYTSKRAIIKGFSPSSHLSTPIRRQSLLLCRMNSAPIATDYRSILKVAIPMSLGAFIQFAVVFTDNYFVAQLDGKAMSAVSYIGLAYVTLIMITTGISSALQIIIARRNGENQHSAIPSILHNALFQSAIIACIQFISLYFITPIILPSIIDDPNIIQYMNEFIEYRAWGFWFYTPTLMLQGYWTGIASTKPVLFAMLITSISNIILDYFLVLGVGIFPKWGVGGAAIATLIAEIAAFFFLAFYTFRQQPAFSKIKWQWQPSIQFQLLKLGLPIVFQMLIALGVWMTFYTLIENRGAPSLQSAFIVRNMYMLCWVSVMGFSAAARTYISTLIAEHAQDKINSTIWKLIGFNLLGVLILSHGLWLYPNWIASQFTNDPTVIDLAVRSMTIILPAILIYCFTSILLAVVEGSGHTMAGFWIELFTSFGYLSFIFWAVYCTSWEAPLLWTSDYVYFILIGIGSGLFLWLYPWRKKVI